jgi:hypothetical protein
MEALSITEEKETVRLVVYCAKGTHHAAIVFPQSMTLLLHPWEKEVFSIEKGLLEIDQLEKEGREIARKKGIPYVHNLD